jgi:multidrug resistance efflux pump
MPGKMSTVLTMQLRLLESENSIREMESEVDYLKEQILLLQQAISEKQSDTDRMRLRLERLHQMRRPTHE